MASFPESHFFPFCAAPVTLCLSLCWIHDNSGIFFLISGYCIWLCYDDFPVFPETEWSAQRPASWALDRRCRFPAVGITGTPVDTVSRTASDGPPAPKEDAWPRAFSHGKVAAAKEAGLGETGLHFWLWQWTCAKWLQLNEFQSFCPFHAAFHGCQGEPG